MTEDFHLSARIICERSAGLRPALAMVLGSGLAAVAEAVDHQVSIPYAELPGFPEPTVESHDGRLVLGRLRGCPVALMQGRAHYYEDGRADAMKPALRALALAGCETLLLTNSAGSLRPEVTPGSLVLISDHINFAGANPLIGEAGNSRFVDMTGAYDRNLRDIFLRAADEIGLPLSQGVYIWFSGPSFETPAEIRAARTLGADVVGMSTVPEVVVGRWLGMRVAVLSLIANPAAGMGAEALSHEQSVAWSEKGCGDLVRLVERFLDLWPDAS